MVLIFFILAKNIQIQNLKKLNTIDHIHRNSKKERKRSRRRFWERKVATNRAYDSRRLAAQRPCNGFLAESIKFYPAFNYRNLAFLCLIDSKNILIIKQKTL